MTRNVEQIEGIRTMRAKVVATLLCGFGTVFLCGPASAEVVEVTYTGTVAGAYQSAIFGTISNGTDYTANYEFDLDLGAKYRSPYANFNDGGTSQGAANPLLSSSLEINGVTKAISGSYLSSISGANYNGFFASQSHTAWLASYVGLSNSIGNNTGNATIPATIDKAFTYHVLPSDTATGEFSYGNDNIALLPDQLTERVISGVPLPPSAPLFGAALVTLGAVGFGVNRKRKATA